MTEREHGTDDARDVLDNPEWSEADIRAGGSLADFAPEIADNIARVLGRPVRHHADVVTDPKLDPFVAAPNADRPTSVGPGGHREGLPESEKPRPV